MSSIDRQPHVLQREKTLAIPRHVIFFDTETDYVENNDGSIEHKLKLGWACYYRRGVSNRKGKKDYYFFTRPESFWHFVAGHCQTKNRLWVIAHQLGFDFTVVEGFKNLKQKGYKVKFFYSGGATTLIKVKAPGRSIMFVDSLNWFKESLAVIGDRIGIPKMKIDFDTASFSYLKTYCKRDVEILVGVFEQLVRFLEGNRISRLCYTIGSTAMAAYLLRHYNHKIYIHNNRQALDLERDSYRGGRTECFRLGNITDKPIYILDVNSLYPFVMSFNSFPVKYKQILHTPDVSRLAELLKNYAVVARVLINTDQPVYAVKRDRTIFPVGRFWATLTTPELNYAIQNNHLEQVDGAVLYYQADIFTDFVHRFYKLRQEFKSADVPLFEHFCKLLLNSLYGKFGQKAEIWTKIGDAPDETDRTERVIDAQTGRISRLRYLLGEVFELTGHDESRHSFPAIASHVTAFARLYLWRLMQICGSENYYYCDTDSLFVNRTGLDNLTPFLDEQKLGAIKIEKVTDKLIIYGLKDYVTADKTAIKGISKSAVRVSDTVYRQQQWPTLRGLLAAGSTDKYTTVTLTKELSREYTKGRVVDTGAIFPFVFDVES